MFHRFRGPWQARQDDDATLAVLILKLLEEQMGTALEVMDRLDAKFGGRLAFDSSEIYPMLQYLEDRGFVVQEPIGDRKAYAVTEAGFAHLAEQARQAPEAEEGFQVPHGGRHGHGPWGHHH